MYKVSCPSCGANVSFHSTASVMAVCGYCKSTLLKDADTVKDIGKMSDVLEDYSPIQINTQGVYWNKSFTVVGRIQLRYDGGFWNEWYILFDDGESGWLSDASGQYVITLQKQETEPLPEFSTVKLGAVYTFFNKPVSAADIRTAECVSGQGELPFSVGKGWEAKVIDFRSGHSFITIDYSLSGQPLIYAGESIYLHDLRCQLLRSEEQISQTAGKVKGKTVALACPNCGGSIRYQAGMALNVICSSCHAEVDCSEDTLVVLKKHNELGKVKSTLQLGDTGIFDLVKYSVIGLMKCQEIESSEYSQWTEYLLFNSLKGFLWLVESNGSWDKVQVLNEWPEFPISDPLIFKNNSYKKYYEYGAEVIYAAGAFNWKVSINDKTRITDFGKGYEKITLERSSNEITWSLSRQMKTAVIFQAFGKAVNTASLEDGEDGDKTFIKQTVKIFTTLFLVINIPIAFFSGMEGLFIMLSAVVVLWLPLFSNKDETEED